MSHSPQIVAAKTAAGYDYTDVFRRFRPIFEQADIAVANLETTLRTSPPYTGYPLFAAPAELAFALRAAGIDIVTTANNHICDKGAAGIRSTLALLDSAGVRHTGAFLSESDRLSRYPLRFEAGGLRFALLAYTYGTNGMPVPKGMIVNLIDTAIIARDLAVARAGNPDCVIVSYHWGEEYRHEPARSQRSLAAWTRARGADIIIGGHPHVVGPAEAHFAGGVPPVPDPLAPGSSVTSATPAAPAMPGSSVTSASAVASDPHASAAPATLGSLAPGSSATSASAVHAAGRPVTGATFYSLGNFVSNQRRRGTDGGIVAEIAVTRIDPPVPDSPVGSGVVPVAGQVSETGSRSGSAGPVSETGSGSRSAARRITEAGSGPAAAVTSATAGSAVSASSVTSATSGSLSPAAGPLVTYDFGWRLAWVHNFWLDGVRRFEVLPAGALDTLPEYTRPFAATFARDTRRLLSADTLFTELQ